MTYIELRDAMRDFTVFSLRDIALVEPGFHRRRLNNWQDKGYIRKVIKGFYIFAERSLDERVLFEIANRIYKPSYVSLESALAYHQLIPESVYGITSVSTRRSYHFASAVADFSYRTVTPRLFFGYDITPDGGRRLKIARPEKAVLDFFYLNPRLRTDSDFDSLRIDARRFVQIVDLDSLRASLARFARKTLTVRVDRFLERLKSSG